MSRAIDDEHCVLVVDDDEDVRESLRDVIELAGCTACLAESAPAALRLLETKSPCLIILDLLMPGMTGADMLEAMREDARLSAIDVIVSTSAPHRAPKGVSVLPKPIDVGVLIARIRGRCRCP